MKTFIKKIFPSLYFLALLSFSIMVANANEILMPPYLQAVTHSSITIMAEAKDESPIKADLGNNENCELSASTQFILATSAKPNTYVHRIVFNDLLPGTKYFYKLTDPKSGKEYKGAFKTAALPGSPFTFAAMGDTRTQVKKHKAVAEGIMSHNPDFSIYSGDLCNKPSYESYKTEFLIPAQLQLSANVPFLNAAGNHEDWSKNTQAFTQSPASNSGEQFFHSFDYGDAHFLVISTEHGLDMQSPQAKFAIKDLKETKAKWKFAMFHIPAYCGGGHGENKNIKKFTTNILEPGGVDVVLTGHSHFYQRNFVNGIYHIVSAGGGAPLYTPEKKDYTQVQAKVHHYMIWSVSPDVLSFKVYDINNNIIDELEIKK